MSTANENSPRPTDPLAAAVEALGVIAHALAGRERLETMPLGPLREKLMEQQLTDAQLLEVACDAFEKGCLVLAVAGHPGAVAIECAVDSMPT